MGGGSGGRCTGTATAGGMPAIAGGTVGTAGGLGKGSAGAGVGRAAVFGAGVGARGVGARGAGRSGREAGFKASSAPLFTAGAVAGCACAVPPRR